MSHIPKEISKREGEVVIIERGEKEAGRKEGRKAPYVSLSQ